VVFLGGLDFMFLPNSLPGQLPEPEAVIDSPWRSEASWRRLSMALVKRQAVPTCGMLVAGR